MELCSRILKVQLYKLEGMTSTDAEDRAYENFLPGYAKAMRAKYARLWEILYDLDKTKIHNAIKKTIGNLMDDKDMGWQEAMHMALKEFLFEELLENVPEKEKE